MTVRHLILRKESKDIPQEFVDWLTKHSARYAVVEHDPDDLENPQLGMFKAIHCHIPIGGLDVSDESVRKALAKSGLNGRANYSLMSKTAKTREDYDWEKLMVYCLKGALTPKISVGCMDTEIERFQSMWVPPEELKKKTVQDSGKKKEKSHWDLMDEIWAELQAKHPNELYNGLKAQELDLDPVLTEPGRHLLWDIMIRILNENKVRTSQNELERFWVSLIRRDSVCCSLIKGNIFRKLGL